MPDIAAQERIDVRLVKQRDVVIDPPAFKPFVGNRQHRHGTVPTRKVNGQRTSRRCSGAPHTAPIVSANA